MISYNPLSILSLINLFPLFFPITIYDKIRLFATGGFFLDDSFITKMGLFRLFYLLLSLPLLWG